MIYDSNYSDLMPDIEAMVSQTGMPKEIDNFIQSYMEESLEDYNDDDCKLTLEPDLLDKIEIIVPSTFQNLAV